VTIETHYAKVSTRRSSDAETEAGSSGFPYRLPGNRNFLQSFFPSQLESQPPALGFNYANQVLLRVDCLIVSFKDYIPYFDALRVERTLRADRVDPKPTANAQRHGAVAYVDETRHDQRQTQEACEAKAPDFVADEIEGQKKCRALQPLDADQWIVGHKRRNDAASEKSKQRNINRRSPERQSASSYELDSPRGQPNQVRSLGDRD